MGASSYAVPNRCRLPSSDWHSGVLAVSARCNAGKRKVQLVERGQEISAVLLSFWPFVVYLHWNYPRCYSRRILWRNQTSVWSSTVSADFEDYRTCRQQGRKDAECSSQYVSFSALVCIVVNCQCPVVTWYILVVYVVLFCFAFSLFHIVCYHLFWWIKILYCHCKWVHK